MRKLMVMVALDNDHIQETWEKYIPNGIYNTVIIFCLCEMREIKAT